MTACTELCALVAEVASEEHSPRRFLIELGRRGAGVRLGPLWVLDAARGGRNPIEGAGFRPEFDDSTRGQPRHFAGVVSTAARLGIPLTRFLSVNVLGDPANSADGRLSETAFEFVRAIRSRALRPIDAPEWVRARLCGATSLPGAFEPR